MIRKKRKKDQNKKNLHKMFETHSTTTHIHKYEYFVYLFVLFCTYIEIYWNPKQPHIVILPSVGISCIFGY